MSKLPVVEVASLQQGADSGAAARNAALDSAIGEWIVFSDPSRQHPPADAMLEELREFLARPHDPSLALVVLTAARGVCFRRATLIGTGLRFDARVRPGFEETVLALRCRLAVGDRATAWLAAGADPDPDAGLPGAEPATIVWGRDDTYDQAIVAGHLEPLESAVRLQGKAPHWLQRTLLYELARYFATDQRARAPTVVVSEPVAATFHGLVRRVMAYVDTAIIDGLDSGSASPEVRQALLSYKDVERCSDVALTARDEGQGLARLTYYVHGRRPPETFVVDGVPTAPAYAKYRACRFFRRTLFHERIAWLPAAAACPVELRLAGEPIAVADLTAGAATARPAGLPGIKARALRWLARRRVVRRAFADAWVFVDRDAEADDNAEHLYRWVRRHHPEVNAWFLLDPASPDWTRLKREGFRLMPGGLRRRLLLLNSDHIASSQPFYASGGFDRGVYRDAMRWRFTFLQHGVIKDDMSHWLSDQPFDVFVTTSPAEYASIAADDTPYTYTGRETRRTGLPRHDRLLEIASRLPAEAVDTILVMPTWRGSLAALIDEHRADPRAAEAIFRDSDYARHWRALLADEALRQVAERHGKRLVFMPHPNAAPYLAAFDAPAHVRVVTKADASIQELFCRSAAMVTDFSSVAFEMAYLRRPTVYYQFDRERFFRGDHNWREGYFVYERDGFGPVVLDHDEVARRLDGLLSGRGLGDYLARMQQALPDRDGNACSRVFETMRSIGHRHVSSFLPKSPGSTAARSRS